VSAESRALAARIFSAFPVTQAAFAKLIALMDIEATTDVPSAMVTLGPRSRMCINPDFVAQHCRNDAELVMLVLHELHHIVLGHTRLVRRVTRADNFAFDAVINAHLCQLFHGWPGTALFRRLYRADCFPEALLRPPEGWRTPAERWQLTGRALAVHRALYGDTQAGYDEILKLLPQVAIELRDAGCGNSVDPMRADVPLLGHHDDGETSLPTDLLGQVRSIRSRWPLVERRSGHDAGTDPERSRIAAAQARREAVSVLRRAILSVADRGTDGTRIAHHAWFPDDGMLPYRTMPDRRGEVRAAAGETPLLWRAQPPVRRPVSAERVHVYLDVSGSMDAVLPALYAALVPLVELVEPRVHLFSTRIADVPREALRKGVCQTTGGTDIAIVTAHLVEQRIGRALVVTDGWVGKVPGEHARVLTRRRARIASVVTTPGDLAFAHAFAGPVSRLPQLPY
jgi:hypothetical protein